MKCEFSHRLSATLNWHVLIWLKEYGLNELYLGTFELELEILTCAIG